MVRLPHHYETTSRIFLLLEHVKGGRLVDFVSAKRDQWEKLKTAALAPHPPPSQACKQQPQQTAGIPCRKGESSTVIDHKNRGEWGDMQDVSLDPQSSENPCNGTKGHDMEQLLSELSNIIPLDKPPVSESLDGNNPVGKELGSEEAIHSRDSLALMRTNLEESLTMKTGEVSESQQSPTLQKGDKSSKEIDKRIPANTIINVEPPTPTTPVSASVGPEQVFDSNNTGPHLMNTSQVTGESLKSKSQWQELPASAVTSQIQPAASPPIQVSSGDHSSYFSPGSAKNSPDATVSILDEWSLRLEGTVRQWAAQVVLALGHLHAQGIVCGYVFIIKS